LERNDENNEKTMSYLITPYFINETILKSDILKIEEVLIEKFGDRSDKSDVPLIKYLDYSQKNNNKKNFESDITEQNDIFNMLKKNTILNKEIMIIEENSNQKKFDFEKISLNTFLKKYIIPIDTSENKNIDNFKSNFMFLYQLL